MPGTVKSELLPDADRSHKCDCQEKVSWKRNLPLDKSHFITETANATLNMIMASHEDEPISWVLYGVKNQLASIEEANDRILDLSERAVSA